MLLSALDIELPSRGFMDRCRDKAWRKYSQEHDANNDHSENSNSSKEVTAAEIKITVDEKKLQDWVVHYTPEPPEPVSQKNGERPVLVAIDLQNRLGSAELTCTVLTEICRRIFGLGVESDSAEACA